NQWIIETHYFWTSPYSYWHMSEKAPDLYLNLSKSSLIIYKGDLNYRKLVYDCKWSITNTSFKEAIGPLASKKDSSPPLLALRTCKAEVLVGIEESRIPPFDDEKDWILVDSVDPNLVLQDTIERIYVGDAYGDIPRGIFIIRGENVVLLGEIDLDKEDEVPLRQVPVEEILIAQREEMEARQRREKLKNKLLHDQGFS
ncbi:354_t:CDS:2, partial [Diversispora eburnea]